MPDDFDLAAEGAFDDPEEPEELESTDLEAAEGGEAPEEPGEPEPSRPEEGGEEPAGEPAEAGPEDWKSHLRPGETPEQAIQRLAQESSQQHGRAASHWSELKELRDTVRSMEPKLSAAERIFAAMQKKQEAEERAAFEKELPDPELEPERYNQMQLRALNERLLAMESRREQEARERLTQEEYQARQEALREVDQRSVYEIQAGLGMVEGVEPEEEFQQAFQAVNSLQYRDLQDRYPEANDQQIEQALGLIRTIWGREAAVRGESIRDQYLRRARHLQEVMGAAPPTATNGHQKPQKAGGKKAPSPQEIEAQAAKAGKGAGVRRTSGGGSVAPPATFEDFAALPEAEQARILEEGKVDEASLWAELSDPDWG